MLSHEQKIPKQRLHKADLLLARGAFNEAVKILEDLLVEEPDNPAALTALGITFTEAGLHEKAVKALSRALVLSDGNAEAHEALGCAYYRMEDFEKAREELERGRELDPDNGSILRNLGVVIDKLGDFEAGSALIRKACSINCFDYQALYALSSVYLREGKLEEAITLLTRIRDENSPVSLRVLAIDHVENLKRYLS